MVLKKTFLCLILLNIVFTLSGQKLEIIKTGRPETFAYNNAQKVVGERWGITFDYIAFDGRNFDLLDSITLRNQVAEDKLAAQKGSEWRNTFDQEVQAELDKQNGFRKQLESRIADLSPEKMIHFEQGKCGKHKYKASVFAQVEKGDQRPFYILREFKINAKNGKTKLKGNPNKPVDFEYPENGIERSNG